jgi:hypothetical protein
MVVEYSSGLSFALREQNSLNDWQQSMFRKEGESAH